MEQETPEPGSGPRVPIKSEDVPVIRITTLTLDMKVGLPGYSSVGAALTATVIGDLDVAQTELSNKLREVIAKEAKRFMEAQPPKK